MSLFALPVCATATVNELDPSSEYTIEIGLRAWERAFQVLSEYVMHFLHKVITHAGQSKVKQFVSSGTFTVKFQMIFNAVSASSVPLKPMPPWDLLI